MLFLPTLQPARHSKLEKADILELTVKHLQTLQRQQLAAAIASDPTVLHRFKNGFGDCAVEVRRYLGRLANIPTGLRHRLGNHLNSCISGIDHLNPIPQEHPQLVPDPLRLEDERRSAFHFVRSAKPNSPPLSPLSCDSACDSSTELETPPRPVQTFPYPTPPSRSASDQDSSPETQKPTVSSTTISPETLRQEAIKNKTLMEPLSIVIDVENYKIGIDASPKRAVDYSVRKKLKRPLESTGPLPKILRTETPKDRAVTITERTVTIPERMFTASKTFIVPEQPKAFVPSEKSAFEVRIPERKPQFQEKRITLPESIPSVEIFPTTAKPIVAPVFFVPKSVISHTAESLAQSSVHNIAETSKEKAEEVKEPEAAKPSSKSPQQSTSSSSDMWRPW